MVDRAMRITIIAFLFTLGCSTSDDVAPDAASLRNRDAARLNAEAVCDRRIACDPTYTVDRDTCVEHVTEQLCLAAAVDCDAGPYERIDDLAVCIDGYRALACDEYAPICPL